MVTYNLAPFAATIDGPEHLKHMMMVMAPLQTVYNGKIENLPLHHIQDFIRCIQMWVSTRNSPLGLKKINSLMTLMKRNGQLITLFVGIQKIFSKTSTVSH